jgi:hypothetical protein
MSSFSPFTQRVRIFGGPVPIEAQFSENLAPQPAVLGSFGWLDKCRRMWKNCERLTETLLNMVKPAFVSLLLKRR